MSDIYQTGPTVERETTMPTDSVAVGMAAARKQAGENIAALLYSAISSVNKAAAQRDVSQPRRFLYERAYETLRKEAHQYFRHFGTEPECPAYLPPPSVSTGYVRMGREDPEPPRERGYVETRGKGPSGKGVPPPGVPGTLAEEAWLNAQGNVK